MNDNDPEEVEAPPADFNSFLLKSKGAQCNPLDAQESIQARQIGFETQVVKLLLRGLGDRAGGLRRLLLEHGREVHGREAMLLAKFNALCPNFPFLIGSRLVPYVHELRGFNKGFTKTGLFLAWLSLLEEWGVEEDGHEECRQPAMVFFWAEIGETMVMHNGRPAYEQLGMRLIRTVGRHGRKQPYTLEPLRQWLDAIGDSWY